MPQKLQILILEDLAADVELVIRELRKAGFKFAAKRVDTESDFLAQLGDAPPDLILADYSLPGYDGPSALAAVQKKCPEIPFIFVSGTMGEENAIEALHHGATDYVFKQKLSRLGPAVQRALREMEQRRRRMRDERRIHELNLLLRASHDISALIISERDPGRLLAEACNILAQTRGYCLAWVGLPEPGSKRVVPAARAGDRADYLDSARITWDETPTGQGPTGTAMRTGQPWICQDTATDTRFAPWREAALARGYASLAAVPMMQEARIAGVVTVYSNYQEAFDEEEIALLQQLAGDLALALHSINLEKAREGAEARLRLLSTALAAAANAIVITDRQSAIQWVNPAFEQLTGYSFAEVNQKKPNLLKSGAHEAAFYRELWETVLSGRVWRAEMINRRKDGTLYTEENTITPVRDEKGEVTHFVAVKEDVTERKRAEARLAAFSQLGHLLGAAQNAVEAGEIIVAAADQLLGWDACSFALYSSTEKLMDHVLTRDTVDGRRVLCGSSYDHSPPSPLARRVIEEGGQLILKEAPDQKAPGAVPFGDKARPAASILFVPARAGAEVVGVLSIQSYTPNAYDQRSLETLQGLADHCAGVFKRISAQEGLSRSEGNYRSLVECSPDAVFLHHDGTFLYANPACLKLFGAEKPEQVVGRSVFDIVLPEYHETILQRIRHVAEGGRASLLEHKIHRLDGSAVEVEALAIPCAYESKSAVQTIMRDITERKNSERRMAALADLGQGLSAAKTAREAAEIIVNLADELLGWDACSLDLYSPQLDRLYHVLIRDTINGQRVDCAPVGDNAPPTPRLRRVIESGGELVLKDPPAGLSPDTVPFGDTARPSAAILFMPTRAGAQVVGVLSIHSYTPNAYDQRSLETLQMLADHCGGALKRISAQEALTASEANYRSLVELSPDAILLHREGIFVYANPGALKLLGAEKPQQVLGLSVFDIVPQENRDVVRQRIRQASEGKKTPPMEQKLRRLDGTSIDIEVTGIPFVYEGKPAVQSILRDITERKRAELRMAAFSNLGQQLSAAKTVQEAGEIIVEVADRLLGWDACSLVLYSSTEKLLRHVLSRDMVNGQHTETRTAYDNSPPSPLAQRVIEEGGQLILKEKPDQMAPGGEAFGHKARPSASILFVPARAGAEVVGLLSIHSYTRNAYDQRGLETLQTLADHCAGALQRVSAQEALIASEANYRSLVELSPDAIFLHRDGTFVYVNSAGVKLLGAEKLQQVIGLAVFDTVPPENHDLVRQRIRQAAEGGTTLPLEQKLLRLDGTSLYVEATSIPCTYEGKPAVQTIMRDTTERRQLEQQLRQSQKMEAIGQLAGGVAHDFNNMLAVIRGHAELLMMDEEEHSPETKDCLKQVVAASERAANLTRQLLAFSRKQVMQSRPLVVNDVIADLTKMLRRIIGEHIDLQCRYAAQLPFVQADAGMIEQVLLNLAVNARDAMPHGGQLLITTETASFDAAYARTHPEAGAGEFVCLTVSDSGTGIAPEHLPRIFEPFFTTKEVGKGTGLGLATVYGIVKQHQGWIEVASQPGAGATFKIFLPVIPSPASTAATLPADAELPGGAETILLVEDDYAVRLITRRVLESHGYKIYEASTAGEALDLWRNCADEVALLLTDIVMPQGVTGRDLAEQLRAQRPALKVIFMSGYSADVIGKDTDFFRRTHSSFLQKPCSSHALLKTVRHCLDAKQ